MHVHKDLKSCANKQILQHETRRNNNLIAARQLPGKCRRLQTPENIK